jgi:hypothetical protein
MIPFPPTMAGSALPSNRSAGNEEGNTMQDLRTKRLTQTQVIIVFECNALSYDLPRSATPEDLADRLANLVVPNQHEPSFPNFGSPRLRSTDIGG